MVFTQEYEGVYYNLSINSKGDWRVVGPPKRKPAQIIIKNEIDCPKEISTILLKKGQSQIYKKAYANVYCQKVTISEKAKLTTKTIDEYILGIPWSCG